MTWWLNNNIRMIQNNFRDIDVLMDIDLYVKTLQEFGANTCMVGCGGITAHYLSDLPFTYRNPYMRGDFFGELVEKCHRSGIRVIARFDFSKTHESIYNNHKEWYTKSIHAEPIRYHDTVATCVNGAYQQERSLEILKEVINRYPVDGVFFNMFGYQTRDYSDKYVGICQCDSCKSRFMEYSDCKLPMAEDETDPIFQKYKEFKQFSVDELLHKISNYVKSFSLDIAVCTYNHKGVDIVRNESNSAVDRPYPFFVYTSENNVSVVRGSFKDKIASNCVINAVDIYYRFMGVSPYLNQIRLYGNMASGAGLDWCIIGDFMGYPDRENFESVKEVFHFHKKYEGLFQKMTSVAKILLINPSAFGVNSPFLREYLGIFKMLKEEHIPFDVAEVPVLNKITDRLNQYRLIIIPGIEQIPEGEFLRELKHTKAGILGTGKVLKGNSKALKELFGVVVREEFTKVRGGYLSTESKSVFKDFTLRNWIYLDKDYYYIETDEGNTNLLPYITSARYGPPERCFGHEESDKYSVTIKENKNIYISWQIGTLYYEQGFEDFKNILMNLLDYTRSDIRPIKSNVPKQVEVFFDQCGEEEYLLQFINLSGFNGTTFFEPIPIYNIMVELPELTIESVHQLKPLEQIRIEPSDHVNLPVLEQYSCFLIKVSRKGEE